MSKNKSYHFIGMGGIGMSSLAHICLDLGCHVSGSDLADSSYIQALKERGAQVSFKQDGDLITEEKMVIFSSAIPNDHKEMQRARDLKCQIQHRSKLLRDLCQNKKALVVSGTHGKTSSSALLAHTLEICGKDPSYMVGGKIRNFDRYGKMGKGEFFALEGDESDGTLDQYEAYAALITNLELDHVDKYHSLEDIIEVFYRFIAKANKEHIVWCYDDPTLRKMNLNGISYGKSSGAKYQLKNYKQEDWISTFEIYIDNEIEGEISIPVVGEHLALNALGVYTLLRSIGLEHEEISSSMQTFHGAKRRLEVIGKESSITFIDDYAHHPTEVKATLDGLSKVEPEKRIVAIFQPHRFTRFQAFYNEFLHVFSSADEVIITDVYSAGEVGDISIEDFVKELPVPCTYIQKDKLEEMRERLKPHDIVISLGAGDITLVIHSLCKLIKEKGLKSRLKVGVVYGGPSPEHYVSVESAKNLIPYFDENLYLVEEFYISSEGNWDASKKEGLNESSITKLLSCDVIFPILHGSWGEDGAAQGLFASLKKPYAGCDYRASSICMDKIATKLIAKKWGVQIAPFIPIEERYWRASSENILKLIEDSLSYPLYVKPSHLGSSIGVHKVFKREDLIDSIQEALSFDSHALVESEIKGRQLEFALYGSSRVHCFPAGEILSQGAFIEYKGKYGSHALPSVGLAEVSEATMEKGMALARRVYRSLGIKGIARIDFFLTDENEFVLNEVNSLPGFTPTSMYPLVCSKNNFSLSDLIHSLLISALYDYRMLEKKTSDIGDEGVIK